MTIAVTGATGKLGRLAIDALGRRAAGEEIVALARAVGKADALPARARLFDYDRPATLAPALAGVETLVFISSSEVGKRIEQHAAVVAAAQEAGVRRVLYTSVLHADATSLSVGAEHRATEAALEASGLRVTLLRNGWYTENYLSAAEAALRHGVLLGASGAGRISAAARADYAEALAMVATTDGHDGEVYELAGDQAFTLADFAAELSRQTAREIPYRDLPEAEYAAALTESGAPASFAQMLAGLDVSASRGALFDDGGQLSRLIGRPTTPLSEVIGSLLK